MDEETIKEWEKSKRIETERMKAVRDLAEREKSKANLAYMPITKAHGFSRDPNVIMKHAERMANVSIVFALLGVVFGIFGDVFDVVAEANKLGLAGGGIAMILGAVKGIGIGVGVLTGIVALFCTVIFARKAKLDVKHTVITAIVSLGLLTLCFILRKYVFSL